MKNILFVLFIFSAPMLTAMDPHVFNMPTADQIDEKVASNPLLQSLPPKGAQNALGQNDMQNILLQLAGRKANAFDINKAIINTLESPPFLTTCSAQRNLDALSHHAWIIVLIMMDPEGTSAVRRDVFDFIYPKKPSRINPDPDDEVGEDA